MSYCSIQRDHLKKNNFNTKSDQDIHQDASIKLHIFSKFSRGVACPLSGVQLLSLFLYEKNHFAFRIQPKYTLKRINLIMTCFPKKFPGAIYNPVANPGGGPGACPPPPRNA